MIDSLNMVICGNCLEVMKKIPDNSIDLLIADTPYNISRKNNFATMEHYTHYKGMDFGAWDINFDQTSWIKLAIEKMKNPSSIIIFNSWQNLKMIADELEKHGCIVRRVLVIKKTNPMPVNRDRLFVNCFEFMLWATKGKKWKFNRRGPFETGFFECALTAHHTKNQARHPTEKNVKVIQALIEILSNENDIILDPFLGGGSTAVAAKMSNRNFLGIEKEPLYCDMANAKLKSLFEQEKIFAQPK